MTRLNDEGLILGQFLEIFLNQAILKPVLAGLTGFAVGDQFIGIQCDIKVKVIIDHDLERLALDALALVFVDGLAVDPALRTITIGVDPAPGYELFHELRRKGLMQLLRDIAQGIAQSKLRLRLG